MATIFMNLPNNDDWLQDESDYDIEDNIEVIKQWFLTFLSKILILPPLNRN